MAQVDTHTYIDKITLARQPTCPSSFLDTLALQAKAEDYILCEALLLNETLSVNALESLLFKNPILSDRHLQILAARHPNLSKINDTAKLLNFCSPARQVLLTRSDLSSELIAALCLDPVQKIRTKAQFIFKKDK